MVLSEEVKSVSLPTSVGEITVLPHHVHLFSQLTEGIVKIKKETGVDYLAIGGGYVETNGSEIHILVSRAYGQKEIDEVVTQKAVEHAKNILKQTRDEKQRLEASALLRRSLIDIKLLKRKRRTAPLA